MEVVEFVPAFESTESVSRGRMEALILITAVVEEPMETDRRLLPLVLEEDDVCFFFLLVAASSFKAAMDSAP